MVFSEKIYLPISFKTIRFGSTLASGTLRSFFIERCDSDHTPTEYEMTLRSTKEEFNVIVITKYLDDAKTRIGNTNFTTFSEYASHFSQDNGSIHILLEFKNGCNFDKNYYLFNKAIDVSGMSGKTSDYYDKGIGLDFTIMVNEKAIKACKYVLGLHSAVFEAMFLNDWKDARDNVIHIDDVDYDVMLLLVKALHNVPVFFEDIETSLKLLIVADKYCIEEIKSQAEAYIKRAINKFNVIELLILAHQLNMQDLKEEALKFITSRKYRNIDELNGYNEMPIDVALLVLNETRKKFLDVV